MHRYFISIPAVFIDGLLYALIAWLLFSQAYLGGDEAAKYVKPVVKFWLNYGIGSAAAITGAIKMFRSTTFSEHQDIRKIEKQKEETDFIRKNTGP